MGIACVQAHHRISLWNTRQPDVLYNPRPSPEGILPFESILIPLPRQFCHDMESRFIHRHSVTFHLIDSEYQREPIRFKQAICQHPRQNRLRTEFKEKALLILSQKRVLEEGLFRDHKRVPMVGHRLQVYL